MFSALLCLVFNLYLLQHAKAAKPVPLRIWLDDYVFRRGETNIMKDIISEGSNQSKYILAGVTQQKVKGTYGYEHVEDWDYLVTARDAARHVFGSPKLKKHHVVSVMPGLSAITTKSRLAETLITAYGGTVGAMPTTFPIPSGLRELQKHLVSSQANHEEIWVLKENRHRGQGVRPVRAGDVFATIMTTYINNKANGKKDPYGYVLAQKFVGEQMLIDNIPFTFRIWTIFAGGVTTVRGYVFDDSIIPFGDKEIVPVSGRTKLEEAEQLIVNLFLQDRTKAKDPWSMNELKMYMYNVTGSNEAFDRIWKDVTKSISKVMAAAIPAVRQDAKKYVHYQEGNFEILGVDFAVDSSKKPWLIEVNYLPSMARKVIDCMPKERRVSPAAGTSNSDAKPVCEDSIFDAKKKKLLSGIVKILSERHVHIDANAMAAEQAVAQRQAHHDNCSVNAHQLRSALDLFVETRVARENGFTDITGRIYDSFYCVGNSKAAECIQHLDNPYSCPMTSRSFLETVLAWVGEIQRRLSSLPLLDVSINALPNSRKKYQKNKMDDILRKLLQLKQNNLTFSAKDLLEEMCRIEVTISNS